MSLFVFHLSHPGDSQECTLNAVNVVTGDVRVNGEVVPDSDKTSHLEVLPKGGDPMETEGRVIRFKALTKGFSKEVKLTRGSVEA